MQFRLNWILINLSTWNTVEKLCPTKQIAIARFFPLLYIYFYQTFHCLSNVHSHRTMQMCWFNLFICVLLFFHCWYICIGFQPVLFFTINNNNNEQSELIFVVVVLSFSGMIFALEKKNDHFHCFTYYIFFLIEQKHSWIGNAMPYRWQICINK